MLEGLKRDLFENNEIIEASCKSLFGIDQMHLAEYQIGSVRSDARFLIDEVQAWQFTFGPDVHISETNVIVATILATVPKHSTSKVSLHLECPSYDVHHDLKETYLSELAGVVSLNKLHLHSNVWPEYRPVFFRGIEQLKCLKLDGMGMVSQIEPNKLEFLHSLARLELENFNLKRVNGGGGVQGLFKKLEQLEEIVLAHNRIEHIESDTFLNVKRLVKLDLSHNSLTLSEINFFIGLTNLTEIDLRFNNIKVIHASSFGILANLRLLLLSDNQINSIRGSFSNLKNIRAIEMHKNQITAESFANPDTAFSSLTLLDTLNLSSNGMQRVDKFLLAGAPNIQRLDLGSNSLELIETDSFTHLKRLTSLNLARNGFKLFSREILKLTECLLELDLSFNQIKNINADLISGLKTLKVLILSSNQAITIQGTFGESLNTLKLDSNRIENKNFTENNLNMFANAKHLEKLDLSFNTTLIQIKKQIFQNLACLVELNMESNQIDTLEPEAFANLKKLKVLNLKHNNLGRISKELFRTNHHLEELDLSHNQIKELPINLLLGLKSLRRLNLSHNQVSTLRRGVLTNGRHLRELDLSSNRLERLQPDCFSGLTRLKKLNLSHNMITRLEPFFSEDDQFYLCSLEELSLTNNSFQASEPQIDTSAFSKYHKLHLLEVL